MCMLPVQPRGGSYDISIYESYTVGDTSQRLYAATINNVLVSADYLHINRLQTLQPCVKRVIDL